MGLEHIFRSRNCPVKLHYLFTAAILPRFCTNICSWYLLRRACYAIPPLFWKEIFSLSLKCLPYLQYSTFLYNNSYMRLSMCFPTLQIEIINAFPHFIDWDYQCSFSLYGMRISMRFLTLQIEIIDALSHFTDWDYQCAFSLYRLRLSMRFLTFWNESINAFPHFIDWDYQCSFSLYGMRLSCAFSLYGRRVALRFPHFTQ